MANADEIDLSEIAPTGEGILVLSVPGVLKAESRNEICAMLKRRFPERKWLVLDGGATVHDIDAPKRLEAKVDLLTAMFRTLVGQLAEEDADDEQVRSLDGGPNFAPRDQSLSLG